MSQSEPRFVDWLAQRLAQAGLKRAFGVPGGGSSLDLLAALKAAQIETVLSAREDAAVIMAGVSGLLAEAPGLAFSTKGPGLASASNGLASAALDRMPALLVSETFDPEELNYLSHQVFPQSDLVAPLLAAGNGVELPASPQAVDAWLAGRRNRPAVMFPSAGDLQAPTHSAGETAAATGANTGAEPTDLLPAIDLLARAKRPVVVAGLEAANETAAAALRQLTSALAAPVLCSYMAKGTVSDDDPLYAGIFTGGAIEQTTVRDADLIILIGLDPVELIRKPLPYQAPVLELSERHYQPHYVTPAARVIAPLAEILPALAAETTASDWQASEITNQRQGFFTGMAAGGAAPLSPAKVVQATRAAFAKATLPRLAVDAGAHMFSACAFWPAVRPRDLLISNGLATMGFALPAALAAALHEPERGGLAMTGDGGLLMCLGELKTAAECDANLTVIVFNDGCLSLIDVKRRDRQFTDLGLTWTPPDFAAVARGFGFQSWRIDDPAELQTTLEQAAAANGPRLIDIHIDAAGYPQQMQALRG